MGGAIDVTNLHTYFETGFSGPLTLCFIAFSAVFMVLGGLTAIIYAIKYFGGVKKASPPSQPPAPREKAPAAPAVPGAETGDKGKIVAAIAAALLEATGQPCRITEIRPASGPHRRPVLSLWRSSAIMEGLESLNNTNWSSR
jgi:Na+-transporting methylmalonyl-CoA/oxaloacetate decarboxylase gamma subunit